MPLASQVALSGPPGRRIGAAWWAWVGLLLLTAITAITATAAATAAVPGLAVATITVQGQPVQSLAGVQVRLPGAASSQAQILQAGQVLTPGTELTLPRGATLVLLSSNDNSITLHPGARFVVGTVTAKGEIHQPQGGLISFQVKQALDYFNISYDRFTAAVKGTSYSVEIDAANSLTFSVTEGVVEVEREVEIRIAGAPSIAQSSADAEDAEDSPVSLSRGIRVAEDLKAGQRKSYKLNVAEYLDEFKNFSEAEAYFTQALNAAQTSGDAQRSIRALFNLMEAQQTMGRPRAVLDLLRRCMPLAQQLRWPPHEAACLSMAGSAHSAVGDFREALANQEQALALNQRLSAGRDSLSVAATLGSLGSLYGRLGEPRKALDFYERSLAIRERISAGQDNRGMAWAFGALGAAHYRLGDYRKAIEYHDKALAMNARLYPNADHPSIASNLANLGSAHRLLHQYPKAVAYIEQSLAMNGRLYPGADHPDIAANHTNLALVFKAQGQIAKAIEQLEAALAMNERLYLGSDHPSTASNLNNLGEAHGVAGDPRKGLVYCERALAMRERLFGTRDHPGTAASLAAIGRLHTALGDHRKAVEYHTRALLMRELVFAGRDHPAIANSLAQLANAHAKAGNAADAARYRERAQAMAKRLKNP